MCRDEFSRFLLEADRDFHGRRVRFVIEPIEALEGDGK
jgi:hypothetical protein